jgi:hypothetical protein
MQVSSSEISGYFALKLFISLIKKEVLQQKFENFYCTISNEELKTIKYKIKKRKFRKL